MLRVAVTAGIELRVVQMLARPTSLATTAERTGLTYRQVNEIAIRHGYPDVRRLEQAVPALQEAAKTELADQLRDGGTTELHPIDGDAPALLPKEPRRTVAVTDRELVRVPVAGIFIVGHTGCGECWETVIRADEQRTSLERALDGNGHCPTCEQPVDPDVLAGLDQQVPQ